ncbi:UPF0489 family protein, partial [Candidatus Omnitrophota bacterium]
MRSLEAQKESQQFNFGWFRIIYNPSDKDKKGNIKIIVKYNDSGDSEAIREKNFQKVKELFVQVAVLGEYKGASQDDVRKPVSSLTQDKTIRCDRHIKLSTNYSPQGYFGPLSIKGGDRVVELGFGTGIHAIYPALLGARVVGIDVSEDKIKFAERLLKFSGYKYIQQILLKGNIKDINYLLSRLAKTPEETDEIIHEPLSGIEFMLASAVKIPLVSNSIDKISFIDVIKYLTDADQEQAIKEILRVARIGALIHIKPDGNAKSSGLLEFIQEIAKENGVSIEEVAYTKIGGLLIKVISKETSVALHAAVEVVEQHNLAYYHWRKGNLEGRIPSDSILINIDYHADLLPGWSIAPPVRNLELIKQYAENIDCAQYIGPAVYDGLFSGIYWVVPEWVINKQGMNYVNYSSGHGTYYMAKASAINKDNPKDVISLFYFGPSKELVARETEYRLKDKTYIILEKHLKRIPVYVVTPQELPDFTNEKRARVLTWDRDSIPVEASEQFIRDTVEVLRQRNVNPVDITFAKSIDINPEGSMPDIKIGEVIESLQVSLTKIIPTTQEGGAIGKAVIKHAKVLIQPEGRIQLEVIYRGIKGGADKTALIDAQRLPVELIEPLFEKINDLQYLECPPGKSYGGTLVNVKSDILNFLTNKARNNLFVLINPPDVIRGIGTSQLIALDMALIGNPSAMFHEVVHSAIAANPKLLAKIEKYLSRSHIGWNPGSLKRMLSKAGDNKELYSHYLIRALQRQIFEGVDKKLERLIGKITKAEKERIQDGQEQEETYILKEIRAIANKALEQFKNHFSGTIYLKTWSYRHIPGCYQGGPEIHYDIWQAAKFLAKKHIKTESAQEEWIRINRDLNLGFLYSAVKNAEYGMTLFTILEESNGLVSLRAAPSKRIIDSDSGHFVTRNYGVVEGGFTQASTLRGTLAMYNRARRMRALLKSLWADIDDATSTLSERMKIAPQSFLRLDSPVDSREFLMRRLGKDSLTEQDLSKYDELLIEEYINVIKFLAQDRKISGIQLILLDEVKALFKKQGIDVPENITMRGFVKLIESGNTPKVNAKTPNKEKINKGAMVKEVVVVDPLGIHAKTAVRIAQLAEQFSETKIWLSKGRNKTRANSRTGIIALGVGVDESVKIIADGSNAEEAIDALVELLGVPIEQNIISEEEPIDVQAQENRSIIKGIPASPGVVAARVVLVEDEKDIPARGESAYILISYKAGPDMTVPVLLGLDRGNLVGLVTATGGRVHHLATVVREQNLTYVSGVGVDNINELKAADEILVNGTTGEVEIVSYKPETDNNSNNARPILRFALIGLAAVSASILAYLGLPADVVFAATGIVTTAQPGVLYTLAAVSMNPVALAGIGVIVVASIFTWLKKTGKLGNAPPVRTRLLRKLAYPLVVIMLAASLLLSACTCTSGPESTPNTTPPATNNETITEPAPTETITPTQEETTPPIEETTPPTEETTPPAEETTPPAQEDQSVKIVNMELLVGGNVYEVRGVTLSTVEKGEDRQELVLNLRSVGEDNIQQMAQAGINTVRTYVAPEGDLLDAFAECGIKVIVGFPHYDDRYNVALDIYGGGYIDYVSKYKDHPAVLFWELGNEYNYLFREHPEWCELGDWWTELKQATAEIHRIDPNHPVSTTLADMHLSTDVSQVEVAGVDVIGLNCYRWDDYSGAVRDMQKFTDLPMYFSEGGADSYDMKAGVENRAKQAQAVINIWNSIKDKQGCFGITYMSWQDEWWKAGNLNTQDAGGAGFAVPYDNYGNEEYWGWVTVDGQSKILDIITELWVKGVTPTITPDPDSTEESTTPALVDQVLEISISGIQYYSGPGWASAGVDVNNIDVSGYDSLRVKVRGKQGDRIIVQLLDYSIGDSSSGGTSSIKTLSGTSCEIDIPISEFGGVELNKVRRIAVHYGASAWGRSLNPQGASIRVQEITAVTYKLTSQLPVLPPYLASVMILLRKSKAASLKNLQVRGIQPTPLRPHAALPAELKKKQDKVLEIGREQGIIAHGVRLTNGGINSLLSIILEGQIRARAFYGRLERTRSGGLQGNASGFGPYWVILTPEAENKVISGAFYNPIGVEYHQYYLVPAKQDVDYLRAGIDEAARAGIINKRYLQGLKGKIISYNDFIKLYKKSGDKRKHNKQNRNVTVLGSIIAGLLAFPTIIGGIFFFTQAAAIIRAFIKQGGIRGSPWYKYLTTPIAQADAQQIKQHIAFKYLPKLFQNSILRHEQAHQKGKGEFKAYLTQALYFVFDAFESMKVSVNKFAQGTVMLSAITTLGLGSVVDRSNGLNGAQIT